MSEIKALLLGGYGINSDEELAYAFEKTGTRSDIVHISDVIAQPQLLNSYQILAFPGGFSFGDHLGSGMVLAHMIKSRLKSELEGFVARGGLVLGICNGFQVLVKMGLVPNLGGTMNQEVSLIHNESGRYQDEWVTLRANPDCSSPWLQDITVLRTPIRHGEGRFYCASAEVYTEIRSKNLNALHYLGENPNGSLDAIAGLCDTTGRVLGLMPHPEAGLDNRQDPRAAAEGLKGPSACVLLFENARKAAKDAL